MIVINESITLDKSQEDKIRQYLKSNYWKDSFINDVISTIKDKPHNSTLSLCKDLSSLGLNFYDIKNDILPLMGIKL